VQVFKGLYRGIHVVAIKVLHSHIANEELHESILKEVAVLRACRHPHIIQVTYLVANLTNLITHGVAVLWACCHPHIIQMRYFVNNRTSITTHEVAVLRAFRHSLIIQVPYLGNEMTNLIIHMKLQCCGLAVIPTSG
jgi:hypothetical protein